MVIRKAIIKAALSLLLLSAWAIPNTYAETSRTEANSIIMELNNRDVMLYGYSQILQTAPLLEDNNPMVPLRFISDAMGAELVWNPSDRSATISMNGKEIFLKTSSQTALINGQAFTLDAPVNITNDSMMVPLRFVGEAFDQKIEYDETTRKIWITNYHQATHTHFSYEGATGPLHWASLDPRNAVCSSGTEQSPVDINRDQVVLDETLTDIPFNYKPTTLTVQNNGHTIQANDASGSNTIIVEGEEYILIQMHFHNPSENQIDGHNFAMEGHLVHRNSDGELAVLGILIESGVENEELAEMWSILPKQETEADLELTQPIDLAHLLPTEKEAYRYSGSLTTPPCSQEVKWIVLQQPIELSEEQIQAFNAIFPDNHRPVQPLHDRKIKK